MDVLPIYPLRPLARRVRTSCPRRDRSHLKAARKGTGGTLEAVFLGGLLLSGKCRPRRRVDARAKTSAEISAHLGRQIDTIRAHV